MQDGDYWYDTGVGTFEVTIKDGKTYATNPWGEGFFEITAITEKEKSSLRKRTPECKGEWPDATAIDSGKMVQD